MNMLSNKPEVVGYIALFLLLLWF